MFLAFQFLSPAEVDFGKCHFALPFAELSIMTHSYREIEI
jgi:hypothetical protein